jgi:hypothetical protein
LRPAQWQDGEVALKGKEVAVNTEHHCQSQAGYDGEGKSVGQGKGLIGITPQDIFRLPLVSFRHALHMRQPLNLIQPSQCHLLPFAMEQQSMSLCDDKVRRHKDTPMLLNLCQQL